MGMRSVLAVQDAWGTSVTTVQWCTQAHHTFPEMVQWFAGEGIGFRDAMTLVFNEVRQYNHISCLDFTDDDLIRERKEFYRDRFDEPDYDPMENSVVVREFLDMSSGVVNYLKIDGPCDGESAEMVPVKAGKDVEEIVRDHGHAQDGISVFYRMGEDHVTLFMEGYEDPDGEDSEEEVYATVDADGLHVVSGQAVLDKF